EPDRTAAVVISERLWRTRLGSDPSIVGSTAFVGGQSVVITGVVADSFQGLGSLFLPELWVPSRVLPAHQFYGRLRDGVTIDQANAEMRARYQVSTARAPGRTFEVRPGLTPPLPARFALLIGAALLVNGVVLLVAAVSLTLLIFARVLASGGEVGVRL